ncbi:hypothetical protein NKH18_27750 [Streptomyces sp. M10(2022)]
MITCGLCNRPCRPVRPVRTIGSGCSACAVPERPSVSRTQWCCLMAVLAVVLGLFCGPATAADAASVPGSDTVAVVAADTVDASPADGKTGIPGCDRNRGHDGGEPGVPARARTSHDHAPSLTGWGCPPAPAAGRRTRSHEPSGAAPSPSLPLLSNSPC